MHKILLVLKREYFTRIKNKTFWISTILLPVVMIAFIAGATYLSVKNKDKVKKVALYDEASQFVQTLKSDSTKVIFTFIKKEDTAAYVTKGFDGLLYSTDSAHKNFVLKTQKTASVDFSRNVETALNRAYEIKQLQQSGIKRELLDSIKLAAKDYFNVDTVGADDKLTNGGIAGAIGFISGILIYITMFIFGAMVMRGVMEEKTNRIAEVMVSSVKPFQLMMGKILGIGAAGLTQLLLWIVIMFIFSILGTLFLSKEFMEQVAAVQQQNPGMINTQIQQIGEGPKAFAAAANQNWGLITCCFIFYFVGGYIFYSSLFAAVGSVINEDPQEAQSLMLPVMMPIIFGFIILMNNLETPDSKAMFWGSLIPFTSPIVMMGRIASNPPWWQLALSMLLLIGGFLITTWMAGKIYRTGILMYGKKSNWKEMMKWVFRKS